MTRFFWMNICRGSFRSLKASAGSRWQYLKFIVCKLIGRPVWRAYVVGTHDESDFINEIDMHDDLLRTLADVQETLETHQMRLVCCFNRPTIHPSYFAQSAAFVSPDGLLGVAVTFNRWPGTRMPFFSCSTRLADGRILTTMSAEHQAANALQIPPSLTMVYANASSLAELLDAHRAQLTRHNVVPWHAAEIRKVVIELENELIAHNTQLGILYPMTDKAVAEVRKALDSATQST